MPYEKNDQPVIPFGTPFDELPDEIDRRCCVGKGCGDTELYKQRFAQLDDSSSTGASVRYRYARISNDDTYFESATVDGLIERLNDRAHFPAELDLVEFGTALDASAESQPVMSAAERSSRIREQEENRSAWLRSQARAAGY